MTQHNPRSPNIPLERAIELGALAYEQVKCHEVDTDSVAVALGYKNSRNGAAQTKIGTLRYYGIIEGRGRGRLAVSPDLETFIYSPDNSEKYQIAQKFLKSPKTFDSILQKFGTDLPTDPILRMYLIKELEFDASRAIEVIRTFRDSYAFVKSVKAEAGPESTITKSIETETQEQRLFEKEPESQPIDSNSSSESASNEHDSILIRLPENRRAWLKIPNDFNSKDKEQVLKQIEAIWLDE